MASFTLKQGDTKPVIEGTLTDRNGGINLTGATVKFIMVDSVTRASKVNAAATVTTAAEGVVTYQWIAADTNTVGLYLAEWQITFTDGSILTVPNSKNLTVLVVDDLGS